MFKIRFAALAALILGAVASVASAQQATQAGLGAAVPDGKIAVINTQLFPDSIAELKQKYDQVGTQFIVMRGIKQFLPKATFFLILKQARPVHIVVVW